jgi:pimeloyl-ACP methyl ester carboxylesterase
MPVRINEEMHMIDDIHYGDTPHRPDILGILVPGSRGRIFTTLYTSAGEGLHPVILMMHGIPGHEQNADLAQMLRRVGFHVVLFHYSGSWGSDGTYSLAHNVEDANTVLDYILHDETHGFDKRYVFAIGHSLGGFVCAQLAGKRPEIRGAALLMPCDIGHVWKARNQNKDAFRLFCEILEDSAKWLNGTSRDALLSELFLHGDEYTLASTADTLAQKPLLIVAATLDTCTPPESHCAPLVRKILAAKGTMLKQVSLPTDHFAADYRTELALTVGQFFTGLLNQP